MLISNMISEWSREDLQNLIKILDPNNEEKDFVGSDIQKAVHLFRWAYFSETRAKIKKGTARIKYKISKKKTDIFDEEKEYPLPAYEKILAQACRKTKSFVKGNTTPQLEVFLLETVLIKALSSMKPLERHKTLNETFNPDEVAQKAKINANYIPPISALGTLALANGSGFGIYLAATTTLGFLTHAIGITLPFAAYTGLTSTIAFIIGPVGWLGVGIWSFWRLTGAEWKKLIPAIIYIISVKYRNTKLLSE